MGVQVPIRSPEADYRKDLVSQLDICAVSLSDRILGYEPREVSSTLTLRAKDVGYVNYTE